MPSAKINRSEENNRVWLSYNLRLSALNKYDFWLQSSLQKVKKQKCKKIYAKTILNISPKKCINLLMAIPSNNEDFFLVCRNSLQYQTFSVSTCQQWENYCIWNQNYYIQGTTDKESYFKKLKKSVIFYIFKEKIKN